MSQPVALVLGANPFSVPLIVEAKSQGFYTVVCSNKTEDPGLAIADNPQIISIIDYKELFILSKKVNPKIVISAASDIATLGVAKLNTFLNINGLKEEQVNAVTNKGNFSKLLYNLGLPNPKSIQIDERMDIYKVISKLDFPVIMKPFFSSGSRGIKVAQNQQEVLDFHLFCISSSFLEKGYIIQSFLGNYNEVGCECILFNSKLIFIQLTNKYCNSKNVPIGHCVPVKNELDFTSQISNQVELICNHLNVKNSVINLDVMVKPGNDPIIIDMSFRLGGNLLPNIMMLQFGINPFDIVIKIAEEKGICLDIKKIIGYTGSIIFGSNTERKFTNDLKFELENFFESALELVFDFQVGDLIPVFSQGNCRFGHALVRTESIEEYEKILFKTHEIINSK